MPKNMTAEARAALLEHHLRSLLFYITSGEHYETMNPYRRPPVKAALMALSDMYGPDDWLDANDQFSLCEVEKK